MPMSPKDSDKRQQRVVGIALVVEEVGKFSKLVFRYPPPYPHDDAGNDPSSSSERHDVRSDDNMKGTNDTSSTNQKDTNQERNPSIKVLGSNTNKGSLTDNIFYTLPAEVMAKLFRTKPALCGQPMTLSIGGTIFCCRSVLLNQSQSGHVSEENSSVSSGHHNNTNSTASLVQLVMFNIIVALLPMEGSLEQKIKVRRDSTHPQCDSVVPNEDESTKEFRSQNFPVIRRIHLSLSRLCAVLEREERRCMYMSRQVSMLFEIVSLANMQHNQNSDAGSGGKKHVGTNFDETEKVELMITAKPPQPFKMDITHSEDEAKRRINRRSCIPLHGNLASELVDVYFALARNDLVFRSSPSSLLTGRDGIIYINMHIAVSIEAATGRSSEEQMYLPWPLLAPDTISTLRPYHTLLFPDVPANELLCNISSNTSSSHENDLSQRSVQKLLLVCDPFKSLLDMSIETALPLSTITGAAASLIDCGACIPIPVIHSLTRFACQNGGIRTMSRLKLDFSQQFSHVCPMFVVVAALTSKRKSESNISNSDSTEKRLLHVTFGDVIRFCRITYMDVFHSDDMIPSTVDHEDIPDEIKILTESLIATLSMNHSSSGESREDEMGVAFQSLEALLISMTTWLRSHSVIVELKDYFVAIEPVKRDSEVEKTNATNTIDRPENRVSPYAYEDMDAILRECISKKYLDGSVSSIALGWKLGLSTRRIEALRDYGVRENRLQVVTRVPCLSDDWDAP